MEGVCFKRATVAEPADASALVAQTLRSVQKEEMKDKVKIDWSKVEKARQKPPQLQRDVDVADTHNVPSRRLPLICAQFCEN